MAQLRDQRSAGSWQSEHNKFNIRRHIWNSPWWNNLKVSVPWRIRSQWHHNWMGCVILEWIHQWSCTGCLGRICKNWSSNSKSYIVFDEDHSPPGWLQHHNWIWYLCPGIHLLDIYSNTVTVSYFEIDLNDSNLPDLHYNNAIPKTMQWWDSVWFPKCYNLLYKFQLPSLIYNNTPACKRLSSVEID